MSDSHPAPHPTDSADDARRAQQAVQIALDRLQRPPGVVGAVGRVR